MSYSFTLPRGAALLVCAALAGVAQPAAAQRNPLKAVNGPTRQLLQQGRYPEALVEIDQRLTKDSLNVDLLSLRAECLLNQPGDASASAAVAALSKGLRLRPNTWLLLAERGYAYHRLHRYPDALADFTTALHQTPAEPALLSQRGFTNLVANRLPEAITDFAQAASLSPGVPEYGNLLVIAHMMSGHTAQALQQCNTLISKHKSYSLGYANRALLRQQQHDEPGARQDANEALRLTPKDSTALLISGFVHQQAGEEAAAQQQFDELQAREKDKSVLFAERGDLYLQVGNLPAAEADWKRAAQLGNSEARSRLAAGFQPRP